MEFALESLDRTMAVEGLPPGPERKRRNRMQFKIYPEYQLETT